MSIVIGLDVGGSTTKIVGFSGKKMLQKTMVRASDPATSTYGGIGNFLTLNKLRLNDVKEVYITGVGASHISHDVLGLPAQKVDEFLSVGLGGLYLSGLDKAIVVSMGTGTSLVSANRAGAKHIIGTGVGGGTLLGLSKAILGINDFTLISEMALKGNLRDIDLSIGDLSTIDIEGLAADITASNFGKLNDKVKDEDMALGIVNLVFQSIGTVAVMASRLENLEQIVFVGSLSKVEAGRNCLYQFSELYKKEIIIPQDAEYSTAIGAALSGLTDQDHRWKYSDNA